MAADGGKITAEEVIGKLKDDGDFDTLRLKIIRKLKENEELRNSIVSSVKQSTAFNRPGAESLKPRQLSDAIYQEIGENVISQISDALWTIIRSSDGMKKEISEAVESVYNKLLNPKGEEVGGDVSLNGNQQDLKKEPNGSPKMLPCERSQCSDGEPDEPPGFSRGNCQQEHDGSGEHKEHVKESKCIEDSKDELQCPMEKSETTDDAPPGFGAKAFMGTDTKKSEGSDEDPDVPPGFG